MRIPARVKPLQTRWIQYRGVLYRVPSACAARRVLCVIPGMFHPGQAAQSKAQQLLLLLQFTHSGTGAADVSSPRPAVGICCKRATQSSGDGSGFSFVSHRWIKCDWLITGQKIDRSERCFYLWCALPDGAAESGRTRSPDVLRFDSANSWRRQEVHTPAHPCWNFQNKTSEKRASRIFLFRFKASYLKFRQCPRWGRFGEFVDETVLVWTNKTRMNHGTKHCCVHDSIFWAQITTGITGLISVT